MRLSSKTFTMILSLLGVISGVFLIMMWASLLGSFAFTKPLFDLLKDTALNAAKYARWTSVWLFIMLTVTLLGCILMIFTKNKIFGIICSTITVATIVCALIVCILATGYCYYNNDKVSEQACATIIAYQDQILQMLALLIIPLSIQIISLFRKPTNNENNNSQPTLITAATVATPPTATVASKSFEDTSLDGSKTL